VLVSSCARPSHRARGHRSFRCYSEAFLLTLLVFELGMQFRHGVRDRSWSFGVVVGPRQIRIELDSRVLDKTALTMWAVDVFAKNPPTDFFLLVQSHSRGKYLHLFTLLDHSLLPSSNLRLI
jgi:hypothetical protein